MYILNIWRRNRRSGLEEFVEIIWREMQDRGDAINHDVIANLVSTRKIASEANGNRVPQDRAQFVFSHSGKNIGQPVSDIVFDFVAVVAKNCEVLVFVLPNLASFHVLPVVNVESFLGSAALLASEIGPLQHLKASPLPKRMQQLLGVWKRLNGHKKPLLV